MYKTDIKNKQAEKFFWNSEVIYLPEIWVGSSAWFLQGIRIKLLEKDIETKANTGINEINSPNFYVIMILKIPK